MSVERIAISLEPQLLKKLEKSMGKRVCLNRSKAIADILQDWLSQQEWAAGKGKKVGAISLLYEHQRRGILERITQVQHDSGANILSSMHIHLNREECLEIVAVRGSPAQLQKIACSLASVRGVKSCKLSIVI